MSATLQRPPSPLDRFVAWILDPDGVMYGDEQERLRHYESSAVIVSLQGILLPWTLAVIAWVGGRPVATAVLVLTLVVFLPFVVAGLYMKRRRVRLPARLTAVWVANAVLSLLPYPLILLGLARAYGQGPGGPTRSTLVGALTGAAAGLLVGALVRFVVDQRRARRPVPDGEDDL